MTALHNTVIRFFMDRMKDHTRVANYTRLPMANECIFKIERTDNLPDILVFLSDAYRFGVADYFGRPSCIGRGDFILIARPEARFDFGVIERARKDGIGVGKIGPLMAALNFRDVSQLKRAH